LDRKDRGRGTSSPDNTKEESREDRHTTQSGKSVSAGMKHSVTIGREKRKEIKSFGDDQKRRINSRERGKFCGRRYIWLNGSSGN